MRTPEQLDALVLEAIAADPAWWVRTLARTTTTDGCIRWEGQAHPRDGYGKTRLPVFRDDVRGSNGRMPTVYTHRAVLVFVLGRPLAAGMTASHRCHDIAALAGLCDGGLCRHRACLNPAHLVEESVRDNNIASPLTPVGANVRKTHCPRCGTELAGANLIPANLRQGFRACATCHARRRAERSAS